MKWLFRGLLIVVLAGCWNRTRSMTCLMGPAPRVGRPVPDEMFGLMRYEVDRVEDARRPELVRAAILETIPSLFPDVSDLVVEPTCAPELRTRLHDVLARRPLPFSRLALAQLRTLWELGDTTDVMDAKGRSLIGLAQLDDAEVDRYRMAPGESGSAPRPALVRFWARAGLIGSNLYANVAGVRRFLGDRLWHATDDREQLLLVGLGQQMFDDFRRQRATRRSDGDAPRLLRAWIDDAGHRLDQPADRVAFEIVRTRLALIGGFAVVFDATEPARALLQRIVDARGQLPVARSVEGGAVDLAMAARAALYNIDVPFDHLYALTEVVVEGTPFTPWAEWVHRYPTTVRIADADRVARVRELDGELGQLRYAPARCHVLAQLIEWTPERDAERRYAGLLATLSSGTQLTLSSESRCRLRLALSYDAIDDARRAELALRVLRTPRSEIAEYDDRGDEHHAAIVIVTEKAQLASVALEAVAAHPTWLGGNAALRDWCVERAISGEPAGTGSHDPEAALTQIYIALLTWDAAHDRDQGRRVLGAWLAALRAAPTRIHAARSLAVIARFAGRLELATEARAAFDAVLAVPPPDAPPGLAFLLRALTLATYRLDLGA
jgi:hypothetical protein